MTNEHACETPISDHVRSALAKMKSGEWFLTLTHPEPSQGSAHYGTDVAVALASALEPSPAPDMREAVEALLAVVAAIRAYLPPDGITAAECIDRVLAATDNAKINPIIHRAENGHGHS